MAVKECTTTKLSIGIQHKYDSQKSNKRLMVETIIGETKREGQRKAKRRTVCKNQKKKKKTRPSCGRMLSHPWPF
jgi:hypothetical protein